MTLTKLKAKNQLTIPKSILERLNLGPEKLFSLDVEKNCVKLTPVEIDPCYTPEELSAIDRIVEREKEKAKRVKAGKEFSEYIQKLRT